MGRPSIGDIVTASAERTKRKDVKELTELAKDSKESIFSLIFDSEKEIQEKQG